MNGRPPCDAHEIGFLCSCGRKESRRSIARPPGEDLLGQRHSPWHRRDAARHLVSRHVVKDPQSLPSLISRSRAAVEMQIDQTGDDVATRGVDDLARQLRGRDKPPFSMNSSAARPSPSKISPAHYNAHFAFLRNLRRIRQTRLRQGLAPPQASSACRCAPNQAVDVICLQRAPASASSRVTVTSGWNCKMEAGNLRRHPRPEEGAAPDDVGLAPRRWPTRDLLRLLVRCRGTARGALVGESEQAAVRWMSALGQRRNAWPSGELVARAR